MTYFWFRRDLRLEDNVGLWHALNEGDAVQCLFIFDSEILSKLEDKDDRRVSFIHAQIRRLKKELQKFGSDLRVEHGSPIEIWRKILNEESVTAVFCNRDYEAYAQKRDGTIHDLLEEHQVGINQYKDHVIFEAQEVLKDDGTPYTVFTPFMRKWKTHFQSSMLEGKPSEGLTSGFASTEALPIPSHEDLGFVKNETHFPDRRIPEDILASYHETRDLPYLLGTSRLSVHLRFGTISIRSLHKSAIDKNEKYWNELIWREFYQMILVQFPHVVGGSFRPQYDRLEWLNNEEHFQAWCEGKTGFPIVDAGMRELNETGFMHNRVRMIVSSFLVKDLLVDWRWGEAYFARKLIDFELASNNGGWQWAAGCGCDAAPYFRIFNPDSQTKKFDPKFEYIRKWIPEFDSFDYPNPIVDHKQARLRALDFYKKELKRE